MTLKQLSKIVAKSCGDLEKGALSISDIQLLIDTLRELESRAIILQYKGMEKLVKGEESEDPKPTKAKPAEPLSLQFKFDPVEEIVDEEVAEPDNQISLIDSIKELSQEEKDQQKRNQKKAAGQKKAKSGKKSINEVVKNKSKQTLAQVLGKKPIEDINKALSVNGRLGIVKELFKGDAEKFKAFIDSLEQSGNRESALSIIDKSSKSENWKLDSNSIQKLSELVQRRFAS